MTLLLLILWPIAELVVAYLVAHQIGVVLTIVLLIAGWPIGAWALRREGAAALRRLSAALSEGRAPGREVLDGGLILLGGTLLMIPGFITDVLALMLLLPPLRALTRSGIARSLRRGRFSTVIQFGATRFGDPRQPYDVDSTAVDLDNPQLHP